LLSVLCVQCVVIDIKEPARTSRAGLVLGLLSGGY
jgi:hypothetical protein